jgi:hypothetical protein
MAPPDGEPAIAYLRHEASMHILQFVQLPDLLVSAFQAFRFIYIRRRCGIGIASASRLIMKITLVVWSPAAQAAVKLRGPSACEAWRVGRREYPSLDVSRGTFSLSIQRTSRIAN